MDGVLIHDGARIDGADRFLDHLNELGIPFLILTNNSLSSPGDVRANLARMGLEVGDEQLWTSAVATAHFVNSQRPGATVFVIGQPSMHEAIEHAGLREGFDDVDYVVVGESHDYSFESIERAIALVGSGSRFVATNPERVNVNPDGLSPGCGALAAMIESATGVEPYFVGKPNPVMIREGLNILGAHSKSTAMIGDRMDTDIRAGVESGLETILVLSGATRRDEVGGFAFQPSTIVDSVADLVGAFDEV